MKKNHYIVTIFVLLWMVLMIWVCGSVMRESDQASLLDGALKLATDATQPPKFHNYSGQYGSYWFLAWLQQLFTFPTLHNYVVFGNVVTTSLFLLGLLCYLVSFIGQTKNETCQKSHLLLIFTALTTPTVILSAPLLASNVLAGAFVLFLVSTRLWWEKWWGLAIGGACTFMAVCLRQDAAFLLPLLCFIPLKQLSIQSLFRKKYVWCFLLASLLAFFLGRVICPTRYMPKLLLDWRLIGCYTLFGLMGGSVVLVWGAFMTWKRGLGLLSKVVASGAVLLPFLMYLFMLYSPRHYFMAGLVPLLLASSQWLGSTPQPGRENLRHLSKLLSGGAIMNLFWLLISPQIQKNGAFRVSLTHATCYPTADGLWPTGGGLHFLYRLKHASEAYRAVDHNQEVWALWKNWNPTGISKNRYAATRDGIRAYSELWNTFHGRNLAVAKANDDVFVVETDRSWVGIGNRHATNLLTKRKVEPELFIPQNIIYTHNHRLLFSPLRPASTKDLPDTYKKRKYLLECHPGVEFLHVKKKSAGDGHLYMEMEGELFKSNYPEIILKYF